jgi:hypothetical protein
VEQERSNKVVSKLHAILSPFLLRRVKDEVALLVSTRPCWRHHLHTNRLTEAVRAVVLVRHDTCGCACTNHARGAGVRPWRYVMCERAGNQAGVACQGGGGRVLPHV